MLENMEETIRFHPRAWKLMLKKKPFLVVANDEPYYKDVYILIRQHQLMEEDWTEEDEMFFQAAMK